MTTVGLTFEEKKPNAKGKAKKEEKKPNAKGKAKKEEKPSEQPKE